MPDLPNVILLHGTDEYAISQHLEKLCAGLGDLSTADMNISRFDGRTPIDFEALNTAVNAAPFLSPRRVVMVFHPNSAFATPESRNKFLACGIILAAFFIPGPAFVQVSQSPALTGALRNSTREKLFEGFRVLKEIVRTEPSSAPAHFYLSSLYTRMGRYLTAFRHLSTAMEANPGQGAYYHQLGVIRLYEGCLRESLAAFQQALRTGMEKTRV